MHKGSCLCGAVTFEIEGDLRAPDACHCSKCRKQSGHFFASTDVPKHQITIQGGRKCYLVSILRKGEARILRGMWIIAVLGSAPSRLDCCRDGCI